MQSGMTREGYAALKDAARTKETAQLLLAARRDLRPLADLDPALQPASLTEAYAVQDVMAEHLGQIGGWKIGAPAPGATPVYAPMPLGLGFIANGQELHGSRRFRGVEAEIGFLLRRSLPVREERYSREEILLSLAGAHPVVEVLESAYVAPDDATQLAMLADLGMNGGFVHGPATADWQSIDLATEQLEVIIDGVVRWEGVSNNSNGPDVLRLLDYLVNEGQVRTGGLEAGQWITTGSCMGKLLAHGRSTVEVRFAHFGVVSFTFAA